MPSYVKTPVAALRLGTRYSRLMSLVRHHKIAAPAKDSSGDYVWTDADVAAAREVLAANARRRDGRTGAGSS